MSPGHGRAFMRLMLWPAGLVGALPPMPPLLSSKLQFADFNNTGAHAPLLSLHEPD